MALKPLRKDEDLSAVPIDEPVLVELEPAGDDEGDGADTVVVEPVRTAKPEKKAAEEGVDEGVKVLKTQMEDMRKASAAREAKLARERDDARREAQTARKSAAETEADLVSNALTAAQSEAKAARAALKTAIEAGDVDAQADAQERIGRAAADVREYERAAAVQSERTEEQPQQPPRTFSSVEESIDARADLTDAERTWLKGHQDAWVDPGRNRELGVAYDRAVKQGLVRGTPAYFNFLEEFMGYTQPARPEDTREPERTSIVAAPVSRDTRQPGQPLNRSQVRLSPQQREMAQLAGVSDREYAAGLLQMEADKQANPEKYARR